jgi:hypothetical protein
LVIFAGAKGAAQTTVAPDLRQLTRQSGYIFAGTVLSVEHVRPATRGDLATVRISFRVEQSLRGPRAGRTFTIRQWAGAWDSGERYQPGEQVVLLLYPPSRLGLTSTVSGPFGRFPVDRSGRIAMQQARMALLRSDPGLAPEFRARRQLSAREFMRVLRRIAEE